MSGFVFTVLCGYFTEANSSLQFLHCLHALSMFFTKDVPNLGDRKTGRKTDGQTAESDLNNSMFTGYEMKNITTTHRHV